MTPWLSLLALASPLSPQLITDTLLLDINQQASGVSGYNEPVNSDGTLAYFEALDGVTNSWRDLWVSDGTTAGTVQLTFEAVAAQESVFEPGGGLFFSAYRLGENVGLWRSNGTPGGTFEVMAPQAWTEDPHDLAVFDGAAWFLAGTSDAGVEVWRSDMATGVTSLAFEIVPGPDSGATSLFAGGGHLYVSGPGENTLYSTDGTLAGLTPIATFSGVSPFDKSFEQVGVVGPRVIFNVDASSGRGWWSSDGTVAGTIQIENAQNTRWLVQADARVYYSGGPQNGLLLLRESDGTLQGTVPVDLATTSGGQRVDFEPGVAVGGDLVYAGYVDANGIEPCRASGGGGGAIALADLEPGPASSEPERFAAFGGEVYFTQYSGGEWMDWVLDLATNEVASNGALGWQGAMQPASHGLVAGFEFPNSGDEPGLLNSLGVQLLLNIGQDGASEGSNPSELFRLGNLVLFQALDDTVGFELFASDGTPSGTQLLADIDPVNDGFPGSFGSFPINFVEYQGRAVFLAFHPDYGYEFWSTDGTPAGTQLYMDANPGPGSSGAFSSTPPVVYQGALFFFATDASGSKGLYKSSGPGDSELVLVADPTASIFEWEALQVLGDRLIFTAKTAAEGIELWSSDGSAAGSELLADLTPGPGSSAIIEFAVGNALGFAIFANASGAGLVRTDGTPAGTEVLATEVVFQGGPRRVQAFGEGALFVYDGGGGAGAEPWVTDGTVAGTQLLLDVVPGSGSSEVSEFVEASDRAFFAAGSGVSGHYEELWMTDSTSAGTELVAHLPSVPVHAGISRLWAPGADRRVVFSNIDANGSEWWVSDGTSVGTLPVTDIASGPLGADPGRGVLVGNRLVFAASDGIHGLEPHAMDFADFGGFAATELGSGCMGTNGETRLGLDGGAVTLGSTFTVGLAGGGSSEPVLWFYDFGLLSLAQGGECSPQLAGLSVLTASVTDLAGASSTSISVPSGPGLVGAQVDFQSFALESGGPFAGLGMWSSVLEVVVGP